MDKLREGDKVTLGQYLVVKLPHNQCDRNYSPEGKTLQLELYPPGGVPIIIPQSQLTIKASDDTAISGWMVEYVLPGSQTQGKTGVWEALVYVQEDGLTFGTMRFEVVRRRADVGTC